MPPFREASAAPVCTRPVTYEAERPAISFCCIDHEVQRPGSGWRFDAGRSELLLAVRGKRAHYKLVEIQPRHFRSLADRYPDTDAYPAMIELAGRVEGALKAVEKRLPTKFAESVWTAIAKGTLAQAKSFLSYAKE